MAFRVLKRLSGHVISIYCGYRVRKILITRDVRKFSTIEKITIYMMVVTDFTALWDRERERLTRLPKKLPNLTNDLVFHGK